MYKRVLVPLDGSPVAESIIPFILDIAGPLDMEVILLRVVEPIPAPAMEVYVDAETADLRTTDAQEYVAAIAAELRDKAVRVDTRVRWGYAADEIVTAARETGADLIAMSTHGRSGLGRVIFGSVAQAVLRQAEAPVFLMRATEAQVASRASRVAAPGAVSAPRRTR
jgi:nucleotide-binding universal stress UspA family protein